MLPLKINNHSNHLQYLNWSQKTKYWLGRLCSFSFHSILALTNRVKQVVFHIFSKTSASNLSIPTPTLPIKSDTPPSSIKKLNKKIDQQIKEKKFVTFAIAPHSPEESEANQKQLPNSKENVQEEDKLSNSKQSIQGEDPPPDSKESVQEEDKPSDSKNNAVKRSKYTRFMRGPKLQNHHISTSNSSTSVTQPSLNPIPKIPSSSQAHSIKIPPTLASNPKPIQSDVVKNTGGGDCQLISILQGLERQYPEKNNELSLTVDKLRQMGVDFIRQQKDKYGGYSENSVGYLDSDLKEYNESLRIRIKQDQDNALEKIGKAFETKKITEISYEKQKKAHQEEYSKLMDDAQKSEIKTKEEFLNRLEKKGFYCSTLHLFALSIILEIPIYVHKELNPKKPRTPEMFNPSISSKAPIHLYYDEVKQHYEYMLYSDTIDTA